VSLGPMLVVTSSKGESNMFPVMSVIGTDVCDAKLQR
jgi:hypothetical protein